MPAPREGGQGQEGRQGRARRGRSPRRASSRPGDTLFRRARPASTWPLLRELGLLTTKPFLYVFNVDEDELADDAPCRPRCARSSPRPTRSSSTPSSSRSSPSSTPRRPRELLESIGVDEPGLDQLARSGLPHARPADLPDGRAQGVPRLDDPQGLDRAAGRRRHPHRLPARLHQGRGRLLRRPRRRRLDGRGQGRGQGPHRGQGLRDGRRRRGGVPNRINLWWKEVGGQRMLGKSSLVASCWR